MSSSHYDVETCAHQLESEWGQLKNLVRGALASRDWSIAKQKSQAAPSLFHGCGPPRLSNAGDGCLMRNQRQGNGAGVISFVRTWSPRD